MQTQLFHNKNHKDLKSFVESDVCPSCFQPLKSGPYFVFYILYLYSI